MRPGWRQRRAGPVPRPMAGIGSVPRARLLPPRLVRWRPVTDGAQARACSLYCRVRNSRYAEVTAEQQHGPRKVVAHNDAADSGNPINDDATARRFNFTGALVPGVTVFGYLSGALLREFGPAWLDDGAAHVRLRQPVYAGDTVTISTQNGTDSAGLPIITVDALNPDGARCAIMSGTLAAIDDVVPDVPQGRVPPRRDLPERRRPPDSQASANSAVFVPYSKLPRPTISSPACRKPKRSTAPV